MKACFGPALLIVAIAIICRQLRSEESEGRQASEDRID